MNRPDIFPLSALCYRPAARKRPAKKYIEYSPGEAKGSTFFGDPSSGKRP